MTHAVPCGIFGREPTSGGDWLGRFAYARSYLERDGAVPIDPLQLPLGPEEYATTLRQGFPGAIRDGMPDFWGRGLGWFAMALVDVVRSGDLSRLGICAYPDCGNVLVDLSKNRSKRFCDAGCGNRAAVSAYRARKAAGQT